MTSSKRIAGWAVCLGLSLALFGCSGGGGGGGSAPTPPTGGGTPSGGGAAPVIGAQEAFIKASNTEAGDEFGAAIALSADGNTLVVAAIAESSGATGIDGNQADNSQLSAGAVYVFVRSGTAWVQQAYIKASNPDGNDSFGIALALSADGNTLAVGAIGESSAATDIGGAEANNTAPNAGAVYVFVRNSTTWTQQAYIKASNTGQEDQFGTSVALSADGNTLAVGAPFEASAATGIGGSQTDETALKAGAVYVFVRSSGTWTQQAYVKASNTGAGDQFGFAVSLSANGDTLAVAAPDEASAATGINGDQSNEAAASAGAVYLFVRSAGAWTQQSYIKASNTGADDGFGFALSLSGDGDTLAVGARQEGSAATGINGDQLDDSAVNAGAVYIFVRKAGTWSQQAYAKASNTGATDTSGFGEFFGAAVALSHDGSVLAVGAPFESGDATGIGGAQTGATFLAGAVYMFARADTTWAQQAYVKASNTQEFALFGVAVALDGAGSALAVGAAGESSAATGINGDQADDSASFAGAVYVFK